MDGWTLNPATSVLIRDTQRRGQRRGHVKAEEAGGMRPGNTWAPGAGRAGRSLPGAAEGPGPTCTVSSTLSFRLRAERAAAPTSPPPPFVVTCSGSPRKHTHLAAEQKSHAPRGSGTVGVQAPSWREWLFRECWRNGWIQMDSGWGGTRAQPGRATTMAGLAAAP